MANFPIMNPIASFRLTACSTLALILSLQSALADPADSQGCALIQGELPGDCAHDNAGSVVSRDLPPNARHEPAGDLGPLGFSISIEATPAEPRRTVAGAAPAPDRLREIDHDLDRLGLRVSVDGLDARPILNVATADLRSSYGPGQAVRFRTSSNYPGWIARAQVIVIDPDRPGRPLAVLPTSPNGLTEWRMPAEGPEEMTYILRVEDREGRRDETVPLPLRRASATLEGADLTGPIIAPGEGEDRTARRGIPVHGAVVTVSGEDLPAGARLTVLGEPAIPDDGGRFVLQRILPPGEHDRRIAMGDQAQTRHVTVPQRELFATGIAEITLGRDQVGDEIWRHGRVAGFAQGVLADGTRVTASVDTRDTELRDMFRHVTRRFPDQVLRQIEDREVWVTTGDDSTVENLAPTSGRLFLRLETDQSHTMWGDFRPEGDLDRMVRRDRTLYGASAGWHSAETAADGRRRQSPAEDRRLCGLDRPAEPARRVPRHRRQRLFPVPSRHRGGNRDAAGRNPRPGFEQYRVVPPPGRGRDYRIDYVQGVVILNAPLSPSAGGPGLVSDSALGDQLVNLVAQYDYGPANGADSGDSYGARAESWVTPHLRFGATLAQEGAGAPTTAWAGPTCRGSGAKTAGSRPNWPRARGRAWTRPCR
ncbi:hypothetical protein [Paracoccus sp. S3-43]|uniref:hypothetical protein n=1 Tax=Paracoccus sp. S3-43 TaxID=3030011 RepID=UPI0023B1F255|nr:hypothetical protein [Paracoccus sp. S3-43]WEF25173.1 hypothetical protein PXD02_04315 [Paracoccus sp. S3-43]